MATPNTSRRWLARLSVAMVLAGSPALTIQLLANGPNDVPTHGPTSPFEETFKGDGLVLKLKRNESLPGAVYDGVMERGEDKFAVSGDVKDGKLVGEFTDKDKDHYPFTADLADGTLTFVTGSTTYHLKLPPPPAPATPPAAAENAPAPRPEANPLAPSPAPTNRPSANPLPPPPAPANAPSANPLAPPPAPANAPSASPFAPPPPAPANAPSANPLAPSPAPANGTSANPLAPPAPVDRSGDTSNQPYVPIPLRPADTGHQPGTVPPTNPLNPSPAPNPLAPPTGQQPANPLPPAEPANPPSVNPLPPANFPPQPANPLPPSDPSNPPPAPRPDFQPANPPVEPEPVAPPAKTKKRRTDGGVGLSLEVDRDGRYFVTNTLNPNSPSALGGIRPGDELVAINGKPVGNVADVTYRLSGPIGSSITISVIRGREKITYRVRLVPKVARAR